MPIDQQIITRYCTLNGLLIKEYSRGISNFNLNELRRSASKLIWEDDTKEFDITTMSRIVNKTNKRHLSLYVEAIAEILAQKLGKTRSVILKELEVKPAQDSPKSTRKKKKTIVNTKASQYQKLSTEEIPEQKSPTIFNKKEFLKPFVDEIKKKRGKDLFVYRTLKEFSSELNRFSPSLSSDFKLIGQTEDKKWAIDDILTSSNNFVILGEPGSGKTSFLEDILLRLYKNEESNQIPIYISLKGYVPNAKDNEALKRYINTEIDIKWINLISNEAFSKTKYLFLFDHLDMADSPSTKETTYDIKMMFANDDFSGHRFIVVCRINQYLQTLTKPTHLMIEDLTIEKIEAILMHNGILEQLEKAVRINKWLVIEKKPLLLKWLELVKKPLLLKMFIKVYKEYKDTGLELDFNKKTELYGKFLGDYLTGERLIREQAGRESDSKGLKLDALSSLAYEMHKSSSWETDYDIARDFLFESINDMSGGKYAIEQRNKIFQQIENEGLLVTYDRKKFQFMHPTFQEYLCARYLFINVDSGSMNIAEVANKLVNQGIIFQSHWDNVIVFFAGLMYDATEIIDEILRLDIDWRRLLVAVECVSISRKVDERIKIKLFEQIIELPADKNKLDIMSDLLKLALEVDNGLVSRLVLEKLKKHKGSLKNEHMMIFFLVLLRPIQAVKHLIRLLRAEPIIGYRGYIATLILWIMYGFNFPKPDIAIYLEREFRKLCKTGLFSLESLPTSEEIKMTDQLEAFIKSRLSDS